jgi:hypothetical protein
VHRLDHASKLSTACRIQQLYTPYDGGVFALAEFHAFDASDPARLA